MTTIPADDPKLDGFEGTIPEFLTWASDRLVYGHVHISEPFERDRPWSRKTIRRVEMVTGGYSDDEGLLHRVHLGKGDALSFFGLSFWESTHRGGLYVYEIPVEKYDSTKARTWLQAADDHFENIARARTLVVRTPGDDEITLEVPGGVALSFAEPERDINEPAGVLTIEPYQSRVEDLQP